MKDESEKIFKLKELIEQVEQEAALLERMAKSYTREAEALRALERLPRRSWRRESLLEGAPLKCLQTRNFS